MSGVWYKRNPADFLYGVRKMTAEVRGVYASLLEMFYEEGGMIAGDNPAYLASQCGCSTRKFNTILEQLESEGKVIRHDDYLTNRRVLSQLKPEFMSRLSRDKREIILSKSFKNNGVSKGLETQETQEPPYPLQGEPSFEDFYDGFLSTHRRGKSRAKVAWGELTDEDRVSALDALPSFLSDVTKTPQRAVTPATYLRDRWFDQYYDSSAIISVPPENHSTRKLYDILSDAGLSHVWEGWFKIASIRVEGNVVHFDDPYFRQGASERARDVLALAGLKIAEAA